MVGIIIEWIGGVIFAFVLSENILATVPIVIVFYLWGGRRNNQHTHPESQESVQTARDRLRDQNHLPPGRVSTRATDEEIECSICLTQPTYEVEINCRHAFCGKCIITYWKIRNSSEKVPCPNCRQNVNIMLLLFSEQERNTSSLEKESIISDINTYNRTFSAETREWMDCVRDLPMLLRHLVGEFFSLSGLGYMFRLRIVTCFLFALFYFISPLDLIPEVVFGLLGFLDDYFVLLVLAIHVTIIYRRTIAMRAEAAT